MGLKPLNPWKIPDGSLEDIALWLEKSIPFWEAKWSCDGICAGADKVLARLLSEKFGIAESAATDRLRAAQYANRLTCAKRLIAAREIDEIFPLPPSQEGEIPCMEPWHAIGVHEGEMAVLAHCISRKFTFVFDDIYLLLAEASSEDRLRWGKRLLETSTIQELFSLSKDYDYPFTFAGKYLALGRFRGEMKILSCLLQRITEDVPEDIYAHLGKASSKQRVDWAYPLLNAESLIEARAILGLERE